MTEDMKLLASLLRERFYTKPELRALFHVSDRVIRKMVQELKQLYPVISTSNHAGWKIATTAEDIPLVEDSIRNNRSKAISIFEGQKQLKAFLRDFARPEFEQLTLNM